MQAEAFQPEELDIIEQAFEQTWAMLAADPSRDRTNDDELKALVRKKLMMIAAAGLLDAELMRKMVLGSLVRSES
jgi:hypothetical protein